MSSLKIKTAQDGQFSVSKWIKHQFLLDASEIETLYSYLAPVHFFNVSCIAGLEQLEIPLQQFLASYQGYLEELRLGKVPVKNPQEFSCALSSDPSSLYAYEVGPGRYMAKPVKPIVQLQPHRFFYSKVANTIQPMVMSSDSIPWGIQAAYPQIFFNPREGTYSTVRDGTQFPNTPLFHKLTKWLRSETVPTTFMANGKKIATPLRLGKRCFGWISEHAGLAQQGLEIHAY